jgi:hypothetical protein
MDGPTTCGLEALLGREAPCPGDPCPFWRAEDGCVFDKAGPELAGRPDVASLLLDVRNRLAAEGGGLDSERLAAFAHALNQSGQYEPR